MGDNPSNVISLREYVEKQFELRDKATDIALDTMNKRLEGMNEFRAQMKDQAATFQLKEVSDRDRRTWQDQINNLHLYNAKLDGKADQAAVVRAYIFTGLTALISIAGTLIALLK